MIGNADSAIILLQVLSFFLVFADGARKVVPTIACGRDADAGDLRIIGGHEIRGRGWPWMASIFTRGPSRDGNHTDRRGHSCGGVIVNKEWILTAAHCLDNSHLNQTNVFPIRPPTQWRVTVGMNNRNLSSPESVRWQTRAVRNFFFHPLFQDKGYSAFNDIALIQLSSPIQFTEHVKPICLPRQRDTWSGWQQCYAAGWGTTSENAEVYSPTLRAVEIPVVSSKACQARFGKSFRPEQHICGGDWYHGNKDSCTGDSGGPLACQVQDGTWYVAGIVSWGMGCGRPFTPGIYTNVRKYESWILGILYNFSRVRPLLITNSRVIRLKRSSKVKDQDLIRRIISKRKA